jgi:hypothetical protein
MGTKVISSLLALLWVALLPWPGWGAYLAPGSPAPPFVVASGDDESLTLDMLRGKVIVLFYESRNVVKKNLELKDELKRLYSSQPREIQNRVFRLVVIDCAEASWPTLPVWKSKLVAHSQKEGLTIYGDWNRRMFQDYRMKGAESNFLIIDLHGVVRYAAAGKISRGRFQGIKNLLLTLVREGQG